MNIVYLKGEQSLYMTQMNSTHESIQRTLSRQLVLVLLLWHTIPDSAHGHGVTASFPGGSYRGFLPPSVNTHHQECQHLHVFLAFAQCQHIFFSLRGILEDVLMCVFSIGNNLGI